MTEPLPDPPEGHAELAGFRQIRDWVRDRVVPLLRRLDANRPAAVRVPLPALTANIPAVLPITWPQQLPAAAYAVLVTVEGPAVVLNVRAVLRPNTRTITGCQLLVASTVDQADGVGYVQAVAVM